jgi:hypothetical protein
LAALEQETVRATVQAFAEGRVHLSAPDPKTHWRDLRVAPHFRRATNPDAVRQSRGYTYTVQTLAKFIGWLKPNGRPQEMPMSL